jgi:hypothetical protein
MRKTPIKNREKYYLKIEKQAKKKKPKNKTCKRITEPSLAVVGLESFFISFPFSYPASFFSFSRTLAVGRCHPSLLDGVCP